MTAQTQKSLLADGPQDADIIITAFCRLQARVQSSLGHERAADCFCRHSGFWKTKEYGPTWDDGYRNEGQAFRHIEACVNATPGLKTENAKLREALQA